jgi:hypothetical protein
MSAPDDDEDAIVVDWQRGWEPTPDDDDPPPPSTRGQQTAIVRELARLGWTDARRAAHLTSRYGYTDVAQLDTLQAAAFLIYLRGCRP